MLNQGLFDRQPSILFQKRALSVSREQALRGSPEEKYAFVEDVAIHVDGFTQARLFIDALLERSKRSKRPGGLWILGDGGVGKSFIFNDIHLRYPPIDTDIARITPVLSLSFEERPSVSNIIIQLLLQLGQDPELIHYRRNADLQKSLIDALPACGTVAILFDEAQHLWLTTRNRKSTDRKGGALGDFLKQLYDKTSVAFIFSGTPGLSEICEDDGQAKTRWSGMLRLKPFEFNNQFVGVLDALDQSLPLPERAGLTSPRLAEKLHTSTQGNFRLLKRLLSEAVYLAATEGAVKLESKHLAESHFRVFCEKENPFK